MQQPGAHTVVSSDSEELILVDSQDRETGHLSKALCHDGDGVLHRAFSVFLFNDQGELLLQQRAPGKRLWPEYWSNSCCSHPRRGEELQEATSRRLLQELGVDAALEYIYKFSYQAAFRDLGSEHELCSVYLGRLQCEPQPNNTEIAALKFVNASELERAFDEDGGQFTPWFRMEWQRLKQDHAAQLRAYTVPR